MLTATNDEQARGYRRELGLREDRGFFPTGLKTTIDISGDIGSGGGVLRLVKHLAREEWLRRTRAGERPTSLPELFRGRRFLIMLSGGESRRLPIHSVMGKIFSTVPVRTGTRGVEHTSTLFDELFIAMTGVMSRLTEGLVVVPGDAHLIFDPSQIPTHPTGVILKTHRAPAELGRRHGVVVAHPEGGIRHWVGKPTLEQMHAMGAIDDEGLIQLDDGLLIFDPETTGTLAELAGVRIEDGRFIEEPAIFERPETATEIDIWEHWLPPLASETDRETYLAKATSPQERRLRERLWGKLHGRHTFAQVSTNPAIFMDYGAGIDKYQRELTTPTEAHRLYPFVPIIASYVDGALVIPSARVYHSVLLGPHSSVGRSAIIEYSDLREPKGATEGDGWSVGSEAVVFGVNDHKGRVHVKPRTVLFEVPVKLGDAGETVAVRVIFHLEDDPKQDRFFGAPLRQWLAERGIDLWLHNVRVVENP